MPLMDRAFDFFDAPIDAIALGIRDNVEQEDGSNHDGLVTFTTSDCPICS